MPPGSETSALVPLSTVASHLLDRVSAAVMVIDLMGVVQYANPYCELLYGRRPEELVGRQSIDYSVADISADLRAEIAATLVRGESWEGDFAVLRGDGTTVEVHAIDSPVFNDVGAMTGVITLAFDASEHRRAQDQLQRMFGVAQILQDIGQTLVSGFDEVRVMQTITDAIRRLTNATSAVYLERTMNVDATDDWAVGTLSGDAAVSTIGVRIPNDARVLRDALLADSVTMIGDLGNDLDFAPIDQLTNPTKGSVRSCLIAPVRSREGPVVGAMIVTHREPAHFVADDRQVAGNIANQAGIVRELARLFRGAADEIEMRA
ncbi:MAG TPA: PAS domain S-box protein, partial [Acidimicrobiia bacterium]|nr:PAS domain S-box protein [Acidimicrobiia bacterium]